MISRHLFAATFERWDELAAVANLHLKATLVGSITLTHAVSRLQTLVKQNGRKIDGR
jgi:hypothetical protein